MTTNDQHDRHGGEYPTGVQISDGFLPVEHLDMIVVQVWDALFGDQIVTASLMEMGTLPFGSTVQACLTITGAWCGSVTVTMPTTFATDAAAALFALPVGQEPADAERADVAGEIANIVAGNLKALLPEPSTLGLPVVTNAGPNPNLPNPHGAPDAVSSFYVAGGHLLHIEINPDAPVSDNDQ